MKIQMRTPLKDYKIFSLSTEPIKNELIELYLYSNDLQTLPVNLIPKIITGFLQAAINQIHNLGNSSPFPLKKENITYHMDLDNAMVNRINLDDTTFNTTMLHHYYSLEVKDNIIDEIVYLILSSVSDLTPCSFFDFPVLIDLINSHVIKIGIHKSDLELNDDSSISDENVT